MQIRDCKFAAIVAAVSLLVVSHALYHTQPLEAVLATIMASRQRYLHLSQYLRSEQNWPQMITSDHIWSEIIQNLSRKLKLQNIELPQAGYMHGLGQAHSQNNSYCLNVLKWM